MRTLLPTLLLCLLALSALGAHHAETLLAGVVPDAPPQAADVYSCPAAVRHREAQGPHWISQVLLPRHVH
jgi:hypothetical protein